MPEKKKKKKGSSESLSVCVVKPQRRGRGGGIIWADVDENGIDHISRLSFTPYYLGGRRERQTGKENISERHEELLKRQHFVTTSVGYTAVSKCCC